MMLDFGDRHRESDIKVSPYVKPVFYEDITDIIDWKLSEDAPEEIKKDYQEMLEPEDKKFAEMDAFMPDWRDMFGW